MADTLTVKAELCFSQAGEAFKEHAETPLAANRGQFVPFGKLGKGIAQVFLLFSGLAVQNTTALDESANRVIGHAETVMHGAALPSANGDCGTGQKTL